jgi:2-oxoglutarate ferredoxin oxidoreductase subunit alpha
MEPAELPPMRPLKTTYPEWSVRGAEGRDRRILSSIYINAEAEEVTNFRLLERWETIQANEVRFKEYYLEDAEFVVVGFGSAGRVSLSAVRAARAAGIKVGLLRPVTLSPYPEARLDALADQAKAFLVVEMNTGQMLNDVLRIVKGRKPVEFYGRLGGMVPFPDEILAEIQRIDGELPGKDRDPRKSWRQRYAPNGSAANN